MSYRVAHLADLHLGFRQFTHTAPGGLNQREQDVTDALRRAIGGIVAEQPDLLVIAGDVFHSVRPTNAAILVLFGQLQRLRRDSPRTKIVMLAGNHETPKTLEAASILPLYRALDVQVSLGPAPDRFVLDDQTAVTCLAWHPARPALVQRGDRAREILVLHAGLPIPSELLEGGWDYIALGDEHVFQQVAPGAWYAGAIEYTSSDPWKESREQQERGIPGKGWILAELRDYEIVSDSDPDLDVPKLSVDFQPVGLNHPFLDLLSLDATLLSPAEILEGLANRLEGLALEQLAVRIVVEHVPADVQRALDWAQIRSWRARAFELQLDFKRPAAVLGAGAQAYVDGRRRQLPLREILAQYLQARELPSDIDRPAFAKLGLHYFDEADQ